EGGVGGVALSADGKGVATGGGDGVLRLWDLQKGTPRPWKTLRVHDGAVQSVTFSPDGRILVSADAGGRLVSWDPVAGRQTHSWQLQGTVHALAFAPDGRHVATANANGPVYTPRLSK